MFPCTLRRSDCLCGHELAEALNLPPDSPTEKYFSMTSAGVVFTNSRTSLFADGQTITASKSLRPEATPTSSFEVVIFSRPPIIKALLSHLPTSSIIDLLHTSRYLRQFLKEYPLAWKSLSFRAPPLPHTSIASPAHDLLDNNERQTRGRALDALLTQVVAPFGTCLTNLDLCNTSVSGVALTTKVLEARISTIVHLSVRNCKNVSIKYHLVPFLQLHNSAHSPWVDPKELALKSLYAYRCRHHRRRPYLPLSLIRRDSDSEPTHELIELCHKMGIWTDTAWCTTPGSRCYRRKDYHVGRAAPGAPEVWVPFDRLWRSSNRVGSNTDAQYEENDVRLWELEEGHKGEALGMDEPGFSDGKETPAHLRKSHTTFVDDVKCDACGDKINERCEQCSIRMHCMGCRKTLCGSCAFNRPLPRKRQKTQDFITQAYGNPATLVGTTGHFTMSSLVRSSSTRAQRGGPPKFWWAPGATRSPNLMDETAADDDDSDEENIPPNTNQQPNADGTPVKLNMFWCCIEPIFSGGGGVAFLGPGLTGQGSDRIRAAPLPQKRCYQDPDFHPRIRSPAELHRLKDVTLYEEILGENIDILKYLRQDSLELQASTCPRNLCQQCYSSINWKVACRSCRRPLCKEHDFRGLKIRKCGFRDLFTEREHIRNTPPATQLYIPPFRSSGKAPAIEFESAAGPSVSTLENSQLLGVSAAKSGTKAKSRNLLSYIASEPPSEDMATSVPSLPSPLPSANRARAYSLSDADASPTADASHRSSTPTLSTPISRLVQRFCLPGYPRHPVQWQGCGAYFCQQFRPVGDCRARCTSNMKECAECNVNVCEPCINDNPSCRCGVCSIVFRCPVCVRKPFIVARCRRIEEERARKLGKQRKADRSNSPSGLINDANAIAESVGDFWSGWENGLMVASEPSPGSTEGIAGAVTVEEAVDAVAEDIATGGVGLVGGLQSSQTQQQTLPPAPVPLTQPAVPAPPAASPFPGFGLQLPPPPLPLFQMHIPAEFHVLDDPLATSDDGFEDDDDEEFGVEMTW